MKIANKTILVEFVKKHPNTINPVNKWIDIIENNEFNNHNELKAFIPSADYVGNGRYVFNIKGKKFRFVVLIIFVSGIMQVRFCGTHAEYDKIKDIQNL
ncbi:MAG: type II toxin-antitoxin system HigB family toxin [Ginsengibacter sp.]|jgi:mRNA interferase HigB